MSKTATKTTETGGQVHPMVICPSCEGFGDGCQLCNGSGKVKQPIADTIARIKPFREKVLDGINVICSECGADLTGKVRIQNDKQGYVKCLEHGLGVTKNSR